MIDVIIIVLAMVGAWNIGSTLGRAFDYYNVKSA